MYQGHTFLAIIPARSGSKGLPDKNIKSLCGKPLLAWSIESALDSAYIDEVVVSTDSSVYADIAKSYGANVPFLRPESLSSDTTTTFDVLKHCIRFYKESLGKSFDYIVLLEPTSPLREKGDIDKMIEKLIAEKADSISSIGEVKEHPAILKKITNNRLHTFMPSLPKTTRRQDNETLYFPYGVAYIAKTTALLQEQTFYTQNCTFYTILPHQCYEVDDLCDFICIEAMMKHFYPIQHKEKTMENKILVIGLGSMGKRRVRNLIALGLKDRILGFDVREDRRKEAEQKYSISTFDTLESAMQSHKIEIFINSTPPHIHMQYAEIAAKNNIHCFIEASVVEKERILALSQRENQNTLILPSSTMYHTPMVKHIKRLVENQTIGKILNINYHTGQYLPDWHPWEDIGDYYVSRTDTGGGREIVPFELTWLCAIFGKVSAIGGMYGKLTDMNAPIDDMYHCLLQFTSGALLNLSIEVISAPKATRELRILGSKGIIKYTQDSNILSFINADMSDWEHIHFDTGTIEAQYINPEEPYIEEMKTFLEAIRQNNPTLFPNSLTRDYEILSLLENIESQSRHLGRDIVAAQSNALGAEAGENNFTQTSTTIPSGSIFEIESAFSSKTTRSLLGVSAAVGERRIADSSQKDNARHNSDENIMGGGR
ncbi:cytidylyltransferase domain-containing protein [Helicobacter cinaedi]|nr:Gfo/Idh/MocA family oxidoreductase [Helicobacter cinaedi]